MPDTTTDYARGFRAGIEAAWRLVCSRAQGGTIDLYSVSEAVQALKRPEPSEDDVLKVAQAIRQQIPDAEPIAIEAAARAALKAMEGE